MGIYPVPLPARYFFAFSSYLYCCVWDGLSLFWQFVEFSLLWSFLAVGGAVRVACQGFLVRERLCRCSGGWSWISSLWSAMKCSVMSYEMSMVLE